jgi:hypothetical protein
MSADQLLERCLTAFNRTKHLLPREVYEANVKILVDDIKNHLYQVKIDSVKLRRKSDMDEERTVPGALIDSTISNRLRGIIGD